MLLSADCRNLSTARRRRSAGCVELFTSPTITGGCTGSVLAKRSTQPIRFDRKASASRRSPLLGRLHVTEREQQCEIVDDLEHAADDQGEPDERRRQQRSRHCPADGGGQ